MSAATQEIVIEAATRTATGKGNNHKLRQTGKIPANLVEKGKSTSIELDPKFLHRAWKSEGHRFTLKLGSNSQKVRITEVQYCPLKRNAIHVDLAPA